MRNSEYRADDVAAHPSGWGLNFAGDAEDVVRKNLKHIYGVDSYFCPYFPIDRINLADDEIPRYQRGETSLVKELAQPGVWSPRAASMVHLATEGSFEGIDELLADETARVNPVDGGQRLRAMQILGGTTAPAMVYFGVPYVEQARMFLAFHVTRDTFEDPLDG